jgi:hypothetical protein
MEDRTAKGHRIPSKRRQEGRSKSDRERAIAAYGERLEAGEDLFAETPYPPLPPDDAQDGRSATIRR